jgi:hypothetical protein
MAIDVVRGIEVLLCGGVGCGVQRAEPRVVCGRRRQDHRLPVRRRGGRHLGLSGDLLGLDLEDAQLRLRGAVLAQRAFGQAWARLPRSDELTRKLDDVGLDGQRFDVVVLELGREPESDFLVEPGELLHGLVRIVVGGHGCNHCGCGRQVGVELDLQVGRRDRVGVNGFGSALAARAGVGAGWVPGARSWTRGLCLGRSIDDEERLGRLVPLLNLFEQQPLGFGDGHGVARGDLSLGAGLLQGALGLGGQKLLVAGRLLVTGGDGVAHVGPRGVLGCGIAARLQTDGCLGSADSALVRLRLHGGAAAAVRGQPLGRKLAQGVAGGCGFGWYG